MITAHKNAAEAVFCLVSAIAYVHGRGVAHRQVFQAVDLSGGLNLTTTFARVTA